MTACSAAPAAHVADLAQRCLRDDLLLEDEGPEAHLVYFAIAALGFVDCYAEALRHLDAALANARSAGSVGGYALARAWRADVLLRCGSLAEAEADALDALALAAEHGLEIVSALALFPLTVVRIESRRVAEAEADLTRQGFGDAIPELGAFAGLLFARGRLHRQLGRADRAHADFAAAGRALLRGNVSSPAIVPWRSDAALALAALGRAEEAATLAGKELELARALDAPRPLGLALRASALVGPDEERLPMLESAVEHLRAAGSSVELARTLIDVGIARLRRDERESGRAALREALDLADRHGAGSLADLAHQELLVAGARPRRRRIAGLDALTAAELRVARLAASGRTNREIASELFLTQKTVETHLGHVFAKLSLASRRELPGALHAGDG
jgi:DNA-binding CsgD family transcriptional regulator